jgi:phosphate/sulfate permease
MLVWIILTYIFSFLMSFSIGANDAANSLATSYGSGAMSFKWLIFFGSIAEFCGAFFCSKTVSTSLGYSIIHKLPEFSFEEQEIMMFSVCIGTFLFIMLASFSKMPISGTHSVVGAYLGSGIYAQGF